MKPHRIRLAGPWEWLSAVQPSDSIRQSRQICQLPMELFPDGDNLRDVVLFRRFHCPTGIDKTTKIFLLAETSLADPEFQLNNVTVPAVEQLKEPHELDLTMADIPSAIRSRQIFAVNLTQLLKPFNELQIRFMPRVPADAAKLISVCLEIHEAD